MIDDYLYLSIKEILVKNKSKLMSALTRIWRAFRFKLENKITLM